VGCGSDEFVNALREVSEIRFIEGGNQSRSYFEKEMVPRLQNLMV